jgi:hypothetical protein
MGSLPYIIEEPTTRMNRRGGWFFLADFCSMKGE